MTIDLQVTGFTQSSCDLTFHHLGTQQQMGAGQSSEVGVDGSGYCRPWTFMVPPASPGTILVSGSAAGDDPDGEDAYATPQPISLQLVTGGAHRPYQSTYPGASWAPVDILGTASPRMDEPLTFLKPANATRDCHYRLTGDFGVSMHVTSLDPESCSDWEATLADMRPAAVTESPFGGPWEASLSIAGGAIDTDTGAFIGGYGATGIFHLDGDGGDAFASNLPAIVFPESSNPMYVLTGSTVSISPQLLSIDVEGTCRFYRGGAEDGVEVFVPIVDGACEPVTFVASEPGAYGWTVQVHYGDVAGPSSNSGVYIVDPMPAPTIEAEAAMSGLPFDVASSVAAGLPSDYEFTLSAGSTAGATMLATMGSSTAPVAAGCSSGALDFLDLDRSAAGTCVTDHAGDLRLTATFRDVTGAVRSTTRTVRVNAFADIAASKFAADINWLAEQGITSGCGPTTFCPDGLVTRGQMATLLSRALDLPAASRDYFTDDETSKHERAINRLREAGITAGCSPTRFCPTGLVTRAQMATFLVRAFHLPSVSRDYFTDDDDSKHEARINALRAAGITSGCGEARFCPDGIVTRGQMAAFLHRAAD